MVTIRKLTEEDSSLYLEFGRKLDSETKFMSLEPGERDWTAERQREIFKMFLSLPTNMIFLALDTDKIVGYAGAEGGRFRRVRHVISISVGVLKEYQGQGIGKRLMLTLEEWAKEHGIHRIDCNTVVPNRGAQHLYEELGYQREGLRRHSVRIDGDFVDEIYMSKLL